MSVTDWGRKGVDPRGKLAKTSGAVHLTSGFLDDFRRSVFVASLLVMVKGSVPMAGVAEVAPCLAVYPPAFLPVALQQVSKKCLKQAVVAVDVTALKLANEL